MMRTRRRNLIGLLVFLLIGLPVSLTLAVGKVEIQSDLTLLPKQVEMMRGAILEAARSGDIEALRPVLEMNELMPSVSFGGAEDPIAHWRRNSADGQAHETMARIIDVLEMDYAHIGAGTANEMYVWPYLAHVPLKELTPAQKVDLHRLMSASEIKTMIEFGDYIYYRLGIGPDGTWHFFVAGD